MYFANSRWFSLGAVVVVGLLVAAMCPAGGEAKPVDVWDQLTAEGGKMFYKMLEYLSDYDEFTDGRVGHQKREGAAPVQQLQSSNRVEQPAGSGVKNEKCKLPLRKGVCRALLPRWRYDPESKSCHEFTFGGCDGNANNFMTYEKCMDTCKGV